jgi:membrane fusion protein, heavy metal efflux system
MRAILLGLGLALCGAGCKSPAADGSREHGAVEHEETRADTPKAVAPADGEMCQHRVLRAICTKCNPRLIPVFQAKGDYCAEHGFAESVCPICHPERGGKPSHAVTDEKAPRDGLRVKFKRDDTARAAGVKWTRVLERSSTSGIKAPASLTYDATRLAQVNARFPGVVRTLKVDIGSRVKQGEALIVIDSPSVGADRARLTAAKSRIEVAEQSLARQQKLVAEGLAAQQSLLAAEQELSAAKGEHGAIAASLSILGASGGGLGGYTLAAPLSGVVTERRVTIGKRVDEEDVLLEIVDTRAMWADVEVAEGDVPRVAVGNEVKLTFRGLAERELTGKVSYVAPSVDPRTRSAKVRVPLENPDGSLRANLFGEARIAVSEALRSAFVDRTAVQQAGGVSFVFVRISDVEFEVRRVKLGEGDEAAIEVKKGLKPGEQVVTTGAFLLKTETSKENIGAGCCEAE